ncbi:MAG: HAD family hydrolase [Eubacteriales bacterium]|nr:HAD family hydrolase [Eubacteriales bacterium]
MNRRALFFDIDGTLLSEITRQVPESAREALKQARALGHLVFVNTGRPRGSLGEIMKMVEPDGWLCGCGTYLEAGGRVLYHRTMAKEQVERLCRAMEEANVDGILEGRDGCYVGTAESRFPVGMELRYSPRSSVRSMDWNKSCGVVEKFCFLADEASDLAGLFKKLEPDIQVIDRGRGFYECVPAGHSKATAIDRILKEYDLSLQDAVVFGDSTNDLAMFRHVPNAVLMGRHDAELEPYASFVTKNVEEDGIRYAMETLGLLK